MHELPAKLAGKHGHRSHSLSAAMFEHWCGAWLVGGREFVKKAEVCKLEVKTKQIHTLIEG